jgi:hypothetical protein
MDEDGTTNWP